MNKRGQVVIFVIVAIIIVAAIILFFLISRSPTTRTEQIADNPESFIDKCVRDSVRETVNFILPQGGFANPTDYAVYNDVHVPYLCKNINYYQPCITQHPRYITELETELTTNIQETVEECFILLESDLEEKNYDYAGGEVTIATELKTGVIETTVYRDFTFSKNGVTRDFDSFFITLQSPLYDLAIIANEIANQEAQFCYFEYVGFDILYNDFSVTKDTLSDSTKIYTITHKDSGAQTNIATRGCVIPAGF